MLDVYLFIFPPLYHVPLPVRSVQTQRWRRFDSAHNTSGVSLVSVSERLHLVLVNSVAMERDGCRLCAAAEKQLDAVTGQTAGTGHRSHRSGHRGHRS